MSVYFQRIYDDEEHADDFEVVPQSEFVVTRTAYRDNTSTYALDGKTSNFKLIGQVSVCMYVCACMCVCR